MNSRIVFPTDSLTSLLGCQIGFSDLTGPKANLWFSRPIPAHPTVLPHILGVIVDPFSPLTFPTQISANLAGYVFKIYSESENLPPPLLLLI